MGERSVGTLFGNLIWRRNVLGSNFSFGGWGEGGGGGGPDPKEEFRY